MTARSICSALSEAWRLRRAWEQGARQDRLGVQLRVLSCRPGSPSHPSFRAGLKATSPSGEAKPLANSHIKRKK